MPNGVSKLQLLIDLKNKLKVGLDQAKNQVAKACGSMQGKLNAFKKSNIDLFNAIEDRVPGVGNAISMLTNPYILVTAAVLSAGAAVYKFTAMANKWHEGLAEINVTAGLTQSELSGLSDKLLEIGGRNVAPIEEVPAAFNRIISAGLDVKTSLDALEPTLRASKAGFTDIETTAMAAVSVMNSSGRSVTEVYDVLFETVKAGNANFKDIAQYLPKIIPMARNAGLALGETAGAYAFLTAQGQTSERATTLTQNAMKALADPDRIAAFKKMGLNLYDAKGKIKPLVDIIDLLNKKTAGLSDLSRANFYGRLGMDSEAASFFAASTQDAGKLRRIIDEVTNSQGALGRAYTDSLTPLESWHKVQNAIKVEMIKIGDIFLPIVSKMGDKVLGFINYFKELWKNSELFRDSIKLLGVFFSHAINVSLIPLKLAFNIAKAVWSFIVFMADEMSNLISKFTGIEGGFTALYNHIRPFLMWIYDFVKQIGSILVDVFSGKWGGLKDKITAFKMPDMADIRHRIEVENKPSGDFAGVPGANKPTTGNNNSSLLTGVQSIASGSQTKSITINIDSFIKGFTPASESVNKMNKDELERWITEMFLRVVRSAETTM